MTRACDVGGQHVGLAVPHEHDVAAFAEEPERSGGVRDANAVLQQLNLSTDLIMKTLLEKGFDPQTEFAADLTGHNLAKTCGYAPVGLRAVLVHLQQQGGDQKKVFSTHPPLAERIKRLPNEPAPAIPDAKN